MNFKLFSIISILLLSISCAQESSKSDLKVSFGAASADFPGGIFVIGKHRGTGAKFSHQLGSSELELYLINGTWDFVAVGWEGSGNFEGNIKCGKRFGINLSGNPVDVNITLNSGQCEGAAGSKNAANNEPLPYKVHSCGIFARRKLYASADADLVTLCDEVEGNHQSFKIVWYEFPETLNPSAAKINPMKTACVNAVGGVSTFNQKIPLLGGAWGLPTTIEGYKQAGCTGNADIIHFPNGLLSEVNLGATVADGTNIHPLVTDNVCVGSELTNNTTYGNGVNPGGSPTAGTLALICNKDQFAMMATNAGDNLRYILGRDIDFSGISAFNIGTVGTPFIGDFDGLGFKLMNYSNTENITSSRGIFNYAQSVDIRNLTLQNIDFDFTLSGSNNFGAGILIGTLFGRASTTFPSPQPRDNRIKNIKIDANSSLTTDNNTYNGGISNYQNNIYTGGLIGEVDRVAYNNPEKIRIQNVKSYAPVSNTTSAPNEEDDVGGLIGNAYATGSNSILILRNTKVEANVTGGSGVGGLIGYSTKAELRHRNSYSGTLTGSYNVGGLIGRSDSTRIMNSSAVVTIDPIDKSSSTPVINARNLAGIVGKMNGSTVVNGAVANLTINNSALFDYVGGIVGQMNSTGGDSFVLNARAEVSVDLDGAYHGGIAGKVFQSTVTSPQHHIQYSSVNGHLHEKTSTTNTDKGGLAGFFRGNAKMNIINISVDGQSNIGGITGENDGELDEMFVTGTVTAGTANASSNVGGVVGSQLDTVGRKLTNIISQANVYTSGNCVHGTNQCGLIVGALAGNTNVTLEKMVTTGFINNGSDSQGSPPLITYSSAVGSNITDNPASFTIAGSKIIDDDPTAGIDLKLIFKKQWDTWGEDQKTLFGNTVTFFKTGSFAADNEAFEISTPAQWNSIQDDLFLMGKSFKLANNIDFNNGIFNGIGSSSNPFKGNFIANGYKLMNIDIDPTATAFWGVFKRVIGDSFFHPVIGLPHDPIKVEALDINLGSNNATDVGFIGYAQHSSISAHIQGEIVKTSGAPTPVRAGGIVGHGHNLTISNSYFDGKIDIVGGQVVGGVLGRLNQQTAGDKTFLFQNKVKSSMLKAYHMVGGLVGEIVSGNAGILFIINDNYVDITLKSDGVTDGEIHATAIGGTAAGSNAGWAGGLIGMVSDTNGQNFVKNNYVNLLNATMTTGAATTTNVNSFDTLGISPSHGVTGPATFNSGIENNSIVWIKNYAVDGTASDAKTDMSREPTVQSIIPHFQGHPWVYDASANKLRLYWELPAAQMQQ